MLGPVPLTHSGEMGSAALCEGHLCFCAVLSVASGIFLFISAPRFY